MKMTSWSGYIRSRRGNDRRGVPKLVHRRRSVAVLTPAIFALAIFLGGASPAIGARTVNMGPDCGTIVVNATQRWTLKLFSDTFEGDYRWTFPGTGTLLISGIRAGSYGFQYFAPNGSGRANGSVTVGC